MNCFKILNIANSQGCFFASKKWGKSGDVKRCHTLTKKGYLRKGKRVKGKIRFYPTDKTVEGINFYKNKN